MEPIENLKKVRLEKLEKIKALGITPYPSKSRKTQSVSQAREMMGQKVSIAGRIMAIRGHGGVQFFDLRDESGKIQLVLKKDQLLAPRSLGEAGSIINYQLLILLDIGDFIDAEGSVFKTDAGEISVLVSDFHLLTKSIRPLPSTWYGFKDVEERYRKRYLDLIINPSVKELFKRKSKFWEVNREFMKLKGFMEIETPILEHVTGGADAKPFVTHHNALDEDFYLRISTELYQKRLIGAGFEKIYTLGPNFRNEGIDDEHLQEYYQIEWYWAYADYRQNMEMVEEMFNYIAKKVYGKTVFTKDKHTFDISKKWEEIDYASIIKEKFDIDILEASEQELLKVLKNNKIILEGAINKARIVDNLWKIIRKDITGPAFLVNEPKFTSPLAKSKPEDDRLTERFHVIIGGTELGNGYSELNDPTEQLQRFKEQQENREKGDEESQMMDLDFVEMLEYGMPPTSGYAHSERLFWFLENITAREGTLFPQMKSKFNAQPLREEKIVKSSAAKKMDLGIDYQKAKELLEQYLKDPVNRKHSLESEAIMRALAKRLGEDQETWGIIGLLHDIDWEMTKDDTKKHCIKTAEILKDADGTPYLIETIQSHGYGQGWGDNYYGPPEFADKQRTGNVQHALAAAETLTGLIVATALIQPDKKLESVKLDSLQKKFKNQKFAANCSRNIILECEKIGLTIDEFLEIGLNALQGISSELGL